MGSREGNARIEEEMEANSHPYHVHLRMTPVANKFEVEVTED